MCQRVELLQLCIQLRRFPGDVDLVGDTPEADAGVMMALYNKLPKLVDSVP